MKKETLQEYMIPVSVISDHEMKIIATSREEAREIAAAKALGGSLPTAIGVSVVTKQGICLGVVENG